MTHAFKLGLLSVALLLATVATFACGGSEAPEVDVSMAEWTVTASPEQVEPGEVRFVVTNEGEVQHQLIAVKNDLPPGQLPVSGGKVDTAKVNITDEIPVLAPGETRELALVLTPGKYVLLCNLTTPDGESHYQNGMYASFLVEPE